MTPLSKMTSHLVDILRAAYSSCFLASADVEYAEPDYALTPDSTPNDALYPNQWALPRIGAPSAWNVTTGSNAVTVCVVDSGFDYT
jgi:hypothetical protein